jgi:hypothetical protein
MARKVDFAAKKPKAKGGKKAKRDATAFDFGANVAGKRRRGFGGGS